MRQTKRSMEKSTYKNKNINENGKDDIYDDGGHHKIRITFNLQNDIDRLSLLADKIKSLPFVIFFFLVSSSLLFSFFYVYFSIC